jgi:hypothetical protein
VVHGAPRPDHQDECSVRYVRHTLLDRERAAIRDISKSLITLDGEGSNAGGRSLAQRGVMVAEGTSSPSQGHRRAAMGEVGEGEPGGDQPRSGGPDIAHCGESKHSGPLWPFPSVLVKTAQQNKRMLRGSPRQPPFCLCLGESGSQAARTCADWRGPASSQFVASRQTAWVHEFQFDLGGTVVPTDVFVSGQVVIEFLEGCTSGKLRRSFQAFPIV